MFYIVKYDIISYIKTSLEGVAVNEDRRKLIETFVFFFLVTVISWTETS